MRHHPDDRSSDLRPPREQPGPHSRRRFARIVGFGSLAVLLVAAIAPVVASRRAAESPDTVVVPATAAAADADASPPPDPAIDIDVDVDRETVDLSSVSSSSSPEPPPPGTERPDVIPRGGPADDDTLADQHAPAPEGDLDRDEPPNTPEDTSSGEALDDGVIAIPVDEPVQMMGLTWNGSPGAEISWRAQVDGEWTDWAEEHEPPDETPDDSERSGVGPIYLDGDGATGLEIVLPEGGLDDARVELLRWDPETLPDPEATDVPEPADGITPMAEPAKAPPPVGIAPKPAIRLRSTWTSRGWKTTNSGCAGGPTYVKTLRHAVVHHSVNNNTYSSAEVPAIMTAIYVYHTDGRGWCDFAYNYAIDRFGRIWQGRSGDIERVTVGGHSAGFNSESVGVVFLGQHQPGESPAAVRPTAGQLNSLQALLAWKLSSNGISPTATVSVVAGSGSPRHPPGRAVRLPAISGHRDVGYTSCPGDHLQSQLPAVRNGAAARIPAPPAPSTRGWWTPFADSATFANRQARDFLGRTATAAERAETENQFERTGGPAGPILWFATRPAVATTTDPAVRLHLAWPGRPPTAAELTARRNRYRAGASPTTVAAEHLNATGAATVGDEVFVSELHENVTGTPIDSATRTRLLDRLASGTTRATLLVEYAERASHVAATEPLVRVIVLHHALLGTIPARATLDRWVNEGPAALAADIVSSPAYRNRIGG